MILIIKWVWIILGLYMLLYAGALILDAFVKIYDEYKRK